MISSLRGTVLAAAGGLVQLEVGGVGYAVAVTPAHAVSLRVGAEARLFTALIVREDEMSLFGFADAETLAVFDRLRSVSGVGPRSALGVLASMTASEVAAAVAAEDDAAFRKVSGIGPKTAKLITVSLAGKLDFVPLQPAAAHASSTSHSVVIALVGLGWPERTAAQVVDEVLQNASDAERASVPALLRASLAMLGPQQLAGSAS
jgi:Holliday junction DNA helicase RuvA